MVWLMFQELESISGVMERNDIGWRIMDESLLYYLLNAESS